MTDKQIEKTLTVCLDQDFGVCSQCDLKGNTNLLMTCRELIENTIAYINRLKEQIADLTVKLEVAERDSENLTRTLKERNEELLIARKESIIDFANELLELYTGEFITDDLVVNVEVVRQNIKDIAKYFGVEVEE